MAKTSKKSTGKALVKWDEEFANMAKKAAEGIKTSEGKFISLKGGRMKFNGADVPDNELQCVIVGWTRHNAYYDPDEKYDADNPSTPICYSFGKVEDEMEPHTDAPDKQNDACAGCPLNEWESGKGKAKACKNSIRLALIAADDLEDLDKAEVVFMSVPPTSVSNFLSYIKKDLGDRVQRPAWSVVTTITCEEDSKSVFKVTFKVEELIEDSDLFNPLQELDAETTDSIDFPYVVREEQEKPARKAKAKTGAKAKPQKFSKRK